MFTQRPSLISGGGDLDAPHRWGDEPDVPYVPGGDSEPDVFPPVSDDPGGRGLGDELGPSEGIGGGGPVGGPSEQGPTPTDLHAFGGKENEPPRTPRIEHHNWEPDPQHPERQPDLTLDPEGNITSPQPPEWPHGGSTFGDPEQAPLVPFQHLMDKKVG